jgi:hypothetical protein
MLGYYLPVIQHNVCECDKECLLFYRPLGIDTLSVPGDHIAKCCYLRCVLTQLVSLVFLELNFILVFSFLHLLSLVQLLSSFSRLHFCVSLSPSFDPKSACTSSACRTHACTLSQVVRNGGNGLTILEGAEGDVSSCTLSGNSLAGVVASAQASVCVYDACWLTIYARA